MKKILPLLVCAMVYVNILSAQNVGIGNTMPGERLDVSGNIKGDTAKLNSLKMAANAGAGKVLTSDVNGVASWQLPGSNVKAVNGLSKKQDSMLLGGRLLDTTRLYLSGKKIVFFDNDGMTQTVMASVGSFGPNTVLSTTPVTQTFKAVSDYLVTSVELYLNSLPFTVTTIQVKNSSGAVLATTSFSSPVIVSGFQVFALSQPLPINASEVYTLSITGTAGTQMFYNGSNPYPDGESGISPSADIAFIINVLQENAVLSIKNNRVGIGIANPDTTFHIIGALKIVDGTEGADRIFTSDASGVGRWSSLVAADIYGWGTSGNAGINAANNFIGTTDYVPLNIRVNNQPSGKIDPLLRNTFWGYKSGTSNTTGTANTATGDSALMSNTQGSSNTAIGKLALKSNISGTNNLAAGIAALSGNATGSHNIALGATALSGLNTGNNNIAIGALALSGNTSGYSNIAVGSHALLNNSAKNNLVAVGDSALFNNGNGATNLVEGTANTAIGSKALHANTKGDGNTAVGFRTLYNNITGAGNSAAGTYSLYSNTTGSSNTASGYTALYSNTTGTGNTAFGTQALYFNTTGFGNVAFGRTALQNNTSGSNNIAIGNHALGAVTDRNYLIAIGDSSLKSNTTGEYNIALGNNSLKNNTTGRDNLVFGNFSLRNNISGAYNTAIGNFALVDNTTGSYNVAIGTDVLGNNTIGDGNIGIGLFSLYSNVSGVYNFGIGQSALENNTTGSANIAIGLYSMLSNTNGHSNVSLGSQSMRNNISGNENTAIGYNSLYNNSGGTMNTVVGSHALRVNTSSSWNTAVGHEALRNNNQLGNTAVGQLAGGTCTSCIETTFLGRLADASAAGISNAAAIGARAIVNTSNKVRIGNTSVTVIEGQVGWSWPSDGRFKTNVQQDVPGLQLVNLLRPVSYNFETEKFQRFLGTPDSAVNETKSQFVTSSQIKHTGLIAQELEMALKKIGYNFSGLHIPQNEKDNYGIAYGNFIPIVIKALQELDAKAKTAEKTNEELKKQLLQLEQKINTLIEK
jgi:trimeric autotransporter adhesin